MCVKDRGKCGPDEGQYIHHGRHECFQENMNATDDELSFGDSDEAEYAMQN